MRPRPAQVFRIAESEGRDRFRWVQPLPSLLVLVACFAISYISAWAYDEPLGPDDPRRLIVEDGDRAQAVGVVVALADRRAVVCPLPPAAPAGDREAVAAVDETCVGGVRATGVDAEALRLAGDPVARLRGTWRGGVLRVTEQRPATTGERSAARASAPRLPCPEPDGGWPVPRDAGTPARADLDARLATIADRVRAPVVATAESAAGVPVDVLVVLVTRGDAAADRADLAALFTGNLCVARGVGATLADTTRARAGLDTIDRSQGPLTVTDGSDGLDVAVPVLTRDLHDDIAATTGWTLVDVRPLVRPASG